MTHSSSSCSFCSWYHFFSKGATTLSIFILYPSAQHILILHNSAIFSYYCFYLLLKCKLLQSRDFILVTIVFQCLKILPYILMILSKWEGRKKGREGGRKSWNKHICFANNINSYFSLTFYSPSTLNTKSVNPTSKINFYLFQVPMSPLWLLYVSILQSIV